MSYVYDDEVVEILGIEISDPDPTEKFSHELLAEMDPRFGAYDASTNLIVLTGLNRTVTYRVCGLHCDEGFLTAHLVSDTPN